jgi:hypothetical protein
LIALSVKTYAIIAPSLMQSMLLRSYPVLLLADALIAFPVIAEVLAEDKLIEFHLAEGERIQRHPHPLPFDQ